LPGGRHILQEYTVDPLDFLQAGELMSPNPHTLPGSMTIRDAIAFFANGAAHRSYPVVDPAGQLQGLVSRSDALGWTVEGDLDDVSLAEVLSDPLQPSAFTNSPIGEVAELMVETGIGRIPILDQADETVVGILSRHDLLKARSVRKRA